MAKKVEKKSCCNWFSVLFSIFNLQWTNMFHDFLTQNVWKNLWMCSNICKIIFLLLL